MNINVRVVSAAARGQIAALQAQVKALQGQLATANAVAASPTGIAGSRNRKSMMAWGNQIQWTGRQLQYNWTLPLLLAGGAATKFALDNEKAFTRVKKVYGDTTAATEYFQKHQAKIPEGMNAGQAAAAAQADELDALGRAFEALSNRYGVAQKEVLETAGAWAAAGASGQALAKGTQLSIKAAILGDMDLAKATESLIAIQSQYSLSTAELGLTLAELNAIENQTGISMQGLIDGFSRSAGVAREAGVDVRHLGAMLAALVPATGSAATAGNALKTIISRLMSPTGDASKVMREFGVDTSAAAWQSSTAVERLQVLAGHMADTLDTSKKASDGLGESFVGVGKKGYVLSDSQKQVVASVLGSRYQMNRFLVLMREMGPAFSYYEQGLKATENRQKVFKLATKELNDVLDSSPQRLKIIWTTLQNGMADAIQPMIPYLLYLAQSISKAVTAFSNLNPAVQKMILVMLVGLAAVGPFVRYMGSLLTLLGAMGMPIKLLIGWWVRYATVTTVVNGVTKTTRRSFIGMIASMIAAPFAKIATGIGMLIAPLGRLSFLFFRMPGLAGAASAGMAGAGAIAAAAWSAGIAGMSAAWRAVWLTMVAIQNVGIITMVRRWLVGLAVMNAGTAAWGIRARLALAGPIAGFGRLLAVAQASFYGMIVAGRGAVMALSVLFAALPGVVARAFASLRGITLGLSVAMSAGWQIMWGSSMAFYNALAYGWTALWVRMRSIMVAGEIALMSAMTTFRIAFLSGWTGLHIALSTIATGAHTFMLRAWAVFQSAMAAVMTLGRARMVSLWASMHAAMTAITVVFWRVMSLGWIQSVATQLAAARRLLSIKVILTNLKWAIVIFAKSIPGILASPWVIAIAAIVAVLYTFRSELQQIWQNVVQYFSDSSNQMTRLVLNAWNALPQGVANALTAVATIVRDAALQIYEWFSYINPFATHSPSLVSQVIDGMNLIGAQFGNAASVIGGHLRGAYADIQAFGKAVRSVMGGAASFEQAQDRAKIKKFAPGALEEFDALVRRLKQLEGDLAGLQSRMDKQQAVVDRWTSAVESMNDVIDQQQKKLDRLTAVQDKWQSKLEGAQDRLSKFANAPIRGMGAMSDAIFENEMAQKRLRLEMMRMEDVGGTLDEVRSKIEAINGAQELLSGTRSALRSAGAGSEILSGYDDQIAALEATRNEQENAASAIENMSTQLSLLERQAQRLDLQNSLAFDPLTRQIEAAANAMEEMPFDKIMSGVQGAAKDIEHYQQKLDDASAAVDKQQRVIDRLTAARDKLQSGLDREQDKLDAIKSAYDKVADAISQVEQVMGDAASAADTLAQKAEEAAKKAKKAGAGPKAKAVSPAVQNFRDAAGGNFANVGGAGIPLRTDWSNASGDVDDFAQHIADQAAGALDGLNPFAPLRKKWDSFLAWMKAKWAVFTDAARDMFDKVMVFDGGGAGDSLGKVADRFRETWASVVGWFRKNIWKPLVLVWKLFWPSIKEFLGNAIRGVVDMFHLIAPELSALFKEIMKMGPAFEGFWNVAKPFLMLFAARIAIIGKIVLNVFAKTIRPALQLVGAVIGNLIQVLKGAFQIVSGFFMLFSPGHFTEGLKKMAAGVGNIFGGLVNMVGHILWDGFKIIVGIFVGIVDGIVDAVKWLYDVVVGHSIIPDLVKAIISWFKKLFAIVGWVWNNVVKPLVGVFKSLFDKIVAGVRLWWAGIQAAWAVLRVAGTWMWNNVLQPVWRVFADLWSKFIRPALALWWAGLQVVWAALKAAGVWIWDNVLKPVWNAFVKVWDDFIRPALRLWWAGVKVAWKALTTAAKWMWDNVLKPVWDKFKAVWDKFIKPFLKAWWTGVKMYWSALKTAAVWMWENVLKPVWNKFKAVWDNYIKPFLKTWWGTVKSIWSALKAAGSWMWENVLLPVYNRVKDLWIRAKSSLGGWWSGIKNVWNSLKGLGKWVYDNVMSPVFDKITGVWSSIKDWLSRNKDMLTGPVRGIVNVVIDAVNAIIKGLNKVANVLPGIDWNISLIQRLEQGGEVPTRRVGSGFKTNGPRAIVGEGKANYPEFVIPTDPTYRQRAQSLLSAAAAKIGGASRSEGTGLQNASQMSPHGVPLYSVGGWIGDKWDDVKGVGAKLKELGKNAVSKIVNPLLDKGRDVVRSKTHGWKPIQSPPLYAIDKIAGWVDKTDDAVARGIKEYAPKPVGGNVSVPDPSNPAGRMVWKGGTFTNRFVAHMQKAEKLAGASISVIQGGFRPETSYSRTSHKGDAVDLQVNGALINSLRRVGIAAGDRTGLGNWGPHTHAVPGPSAGYAAGSAVWQFQDYMARGGMSQPLNSPWGLKSGGVALARRGPTQALLGDGRYDEAVVPLPKGWRNSETLIGGSSESKKEYHFHGDLSFPNITDPGDAEAFIRNLESLAKD